MSNIEFWKPVHQLFDYDRPLTTGEELDQFYIERSDSPIGNLIDALALEERAAKFLLAGHKGSGKTTELRRLEQQMNGQYTVIWIDTETALDRYNIEYAEVLLLIGLEIYRKAEVDEWELSHDVLQALRDSLKTVTEQDKKSQDEGFSVPEFLQKMGLWLKSGLARETTSKLEIRPVLSNVIARVNDIIAAAETQRKKKLLVIVDGLDRHDQEIALAMFSSDLLTELKCHTIYTIPIALRYASSFRLPMQAFECLDLSNPAVFQCDSNICPTQEPDLRGRLLLRRAIEKRLKTLDSRDQNLFEPEALDLLCQMSGGVMRDLMRLAGTACKVALRKQAKRVDRAIAEEAVRKEYSSYNLEDYHYPELAAIHKAGRQTSRVHSLPKKGEFVIFDELLQNKLALGYQDEATGRSWFDIHPILLKDLEDWQATQDQGQNQSQDQNQDQSQDQNQDESHAS